MDWKIELEKKSKELNIKKEERYDNTSQGNNSLRDRSNSGRRSNVNLSNIREEINNNVTEKGGKGMITVEAALSDLEAIAKGEGKYTGKTDIQKVIEVAKVLIKFLSTMRSNQLLTDGEKANIRKARETRAAKEVKK